MSHLTDVHLDISLQNGALPSRTSICTNYGLITKSLISIKAEVNIYYVDNRRLRTASAKKHSAVYTAK